MSDGPKEKTTKVKPETLYISLMSVANITKIKKHLSAIAKVMGRVIANQQGGGWRINYCPNAGEVSFFNGHTLVKSRIAFRCRNETPIKQGE